LNEQKLKHIGFNYRYLIIIWYIGTNFTGSQRQPQKRTVEGCLISSLKKTNYIEDAQTNLFRAGMRTDKGVHAREAAFAFSTNKKMIPRLLDSDLPTDIGLIRFAEVSEHFHPRWNCLEKEYQYFLPVPQKELKSLNLENIRKILKLIAGRHDFRHFSKTDHTKPNQNTVITLKSCSIFEQPHGLLFSFTAQAFLWEQIRRTVQFLYQIGKETRTVDDLTRLLTSPSDPENNHRIHREKPLPATGLTLYRVQFSTEIKFQEYQAKLYHKRKFFQENLIFYQQNTYWLEKFKKNLFQGLKDQ